MPKNTTENGWEEKRMDLLILWDELFIAKDRPRYKEEFETFAAKVQHIAKEEYGRGRVDERGNYVMTFKTKEHLKGFIADIRAEERHRITSLIEGLVGGPSEEFGWTGDMYRGYNQALDDLLSKIRGETWNADPNHSNETPKVGIQEETECCEKCIKHPKSDLVCKRFCPCHHKPRTEETGPKGVTTNDLPTTNKSVMISFAPPEETEKEGASFSGRAMEMLKGFHAEMGTHCEKHKEKGSASCLACKLVKDAKVRFGKIMRVLREENPTPQSREQGGEKKCCDKHIYYWSKCKTNQ